MLRKQQEVVHMVAKYSRCWPSGRLNHSFNYKGFCTCKQVTVFKELKDKFWFLRTLRTSNFFKEFKGQWEAWVLAIGSFIVFSAVFPGFSLVSDLRGKLGDLGGKVGSACG